MVEKGEIVMFFWEHKLSGVVEIAEGVVEYMHPSGCVAVTSDLQVDASDAPMVSGEENFLLVPAENVIAAKSGEPKPQWLINREYRTQR